MNGYAYRISQVFAKEGSLPKFFMFLIYDHLYVIIALHYCYAWNMYLHWFYTHFCKQTRLFSAIISPKLSYPCKTYTIKTNCNVNNCQTNGIRKLNFACPSLIKPLYKNHGKPNALSKSRISLQCTNIVNIFRKMVKSWENN